MSKKKIALVIITLMLLVIAVGAIFGYEYIEEKLIPKDSGNTIETDTEPKEEQPLVVPEKKVQIYQGTDRPIAVMIDNHSGAWPQANLHR